MKLRRRKELNHLVMFLWIIFYLKESENVSFNEISVYHKESFNPDLYKLISIDLFSTFVELAIYTKKIH